MLDPRWSYFGCNPLPGSRSQGAQDDPPCERSQDTTTQCIRHTQPEGDVLFPAIVPRGLSHSSRCPTANSNRRTKILGTGRERVFRSPFSLKDKSYCQAPFFHHGFLCAKGLGPQ